MGRWSDANPVSPRPGISNTSPLLSPPLYSVLYVKIVSDLPFVVPWIGVALWAYAHHLQSVSQKNNRVVWSSSDSEPRRMSAISVNAESSVRIKVTLRVV